MNIEKIAYHNLDKEVANEKLDIKDFDDLVNILIDLGAYDYDILGSKKEIILYSFDTDMLKAVGVSTDDIREIAKENVDKLVIYTNLDY